MRKISAKLFYSLTCDSRGDVVKKCILSRALEATLFDGAKQFRHICHRALKEHFCGIIFLLSSKEDIFSGISYLQLWRPSCSVEKFWRRNISLKLF